MSNIVYNSNNFVSYSYGKVIFNILLKKQLSIVYNCDFICFIYAHDFVIVKEDTHFSELFTNRFIRIVIGLHD